MCHGQKSRFVGNKLIPPLIGILIINWYIKPYYWVDDHPLLYGNNGSLDPIAHISSIEVSGSWQVGLLSVTSDETALKNMFKKNTSFQDPGSDTVDGRNPTPVDR